MKTKNACFRVGGAIVDEAALAGRPVNANHLRSLIAEATSAES